VPQAHGLRQDVVTVCIGPQGADRHDNLFNRVNVSAGDGLQRDHDMGRGKIGIDRFVRCGCMTALPGYGNVELVRCGQQWS